MAYSFSAAQFCNSVVCMRSMRETKVVHAVSSCQSFVIAEHGVACVWGDYAILSL